MEEHILQLFGAVFTETNNEVRAQIEEEIGSLLGTEEFYTALFSLFDQKITVNIQKMAIISIQRALKSDKVELPQELKSFCFQSLIQIFPKLSLEAHPSLEKLFDIFADDFNKNQLLENFLEISNLPGLLEDANFHVVAAMIVKSVVKLVKVKRPNEAELFAFVVNNLVLPILPLTKDGDLRTTQMVFHSASRALYVPHQLRGKKEIEKIFTDFFAPNEETLKQIGAALLEDTAFMLQPVATKEFEKAAVEGIKFLSAFAMFAKDGLDEQTVQHLLAVMKAMFTASIDTKVVGKTLELLDVLYNYVGITGIIDENVEYFVGEVFAKLFVLKPAEIEMMETDPFEFVMNVDKVCSDWSDPRASVQIIVNNAMKKHSEALYASLYQYAEAVLASPESSAQVFAALHLFSTVIYKNDTDEFAQFLPTIASLCDNEDFIVRAAAFKVLSNAIDSVHAVDALEVCLQHINDDSKLVAYYAALSVASMFNTIQAANKKDEYLAQLQESSGEIIGIFLEIGKEFNDDNLEYSIISIIDFFGDAILPFAEEISDTLAQKYIAECTNEEDVDATGSSLIPGAIETMISSLKKKEEAGAVLLHIFEVLLSVIDALSEKKVDLEDSFRMVSKVVLALPQFTPDCWVVLQHIVQAFENDEVLELSSAEFLIGNMIARDASIGENENLQALIDFLGACVEKESENLSSALHLLSGLVSKIANPEFTQMIAPFVPLIGAYLEENDGTLQYDSGVESLVSAMIYQYGTESLQIFGEMPILAQWAEQTEFPFLQKALIKHLNEIAQVDSEVAVNALASSIRAVYDQINAPEGEDDYIVKDKDLEEEEEGEGEDEGDAIDFDLLAKKKDMVGYADSNVQYFSDSAVIREFHTFLVSIQSSEVFAAAAQLLASSEEEEQINYLSCIDQMEAYAAKLEQKTI